MAFDTMTGEARTFEAGGGAEGIATTSSGQVWVGSLKESFVSVFWFGGSDAPRTLQNLKLRYKFAVPFPLRLAYDPVSDTVAVASLDLNGVLDPATRDVAECGLRSYSTLSMEMVQHTVLKTERGPVRMEGLVAVSLGGRGYLWTGGFAC